MQYQCEAKAWGPVPRPKNVKMLQQRGFGLVRAILLGDNSLSVQDVIVGSGRNHLKELASVFFPKNSFLILGSITVG